MNEQQYILQQAVEAANSVVGLMLPNREPPYDGEHETFVQLSLPNGGHEMFGVKVKKAVDRLHTLYFLHEEVQKISPRTLLVAPYISQTLAEECHRLGLNFIDMAGNVYIDVPGCLVFVSGKPRPREFLPAMEHSALRTANGLRIVFALLTEPGLVQQTQRDIAAHAGVALGSVSRILENLQDVGHLSKGHRTERRLLAIDELSRHWSQQYPVSLRHRLNPRRYSTAAHANWQDMVLSPEEAVWGGEFAADCMNGYITPIEATIYSWMPRDHFIVEHRLRPDLKGDVEILDAFWHPPGPARTALAPALLVYADLMASRDGRSREAASRLWEMMSHG